jgi:enterochelin esterase-like enzyme
LNPFQRAAGRARRRKVLLGVLVALVLAGVSARTVVIWVGERFRDLQEAAIFARHLNGKLRRLSYYSAMLRRRETVLLYLPPSYGNPDTANRRYPVVYLLHGCPGQPRDWLVKGDLHDTVERLIRSHRAQEMILVMTDGSGPRGRFDCTLYMDNARRRYPAETAFIRELVPLIDRRFQSIPSREGRALLGLSSGGFAALNLGVRHPDLFAVLAAHSGYFWAASDSRSVRAVLGTDRTAWAANSPAEHLAALPPALRPHIYLNVGRSDPMRAESETFARQLQQLGIDFALHETKGTHSWRYWRQNLPDSLAWVSSRLGAGAGPRARAPAPAHAWMPSSRSTSTSTNTVQGRPFGAVDFVASCSCSSDVLVLGSEAT